MCGIIGILGPELGSRRRDVAGVMLATLAHRGPDGFGLAERDGCVLGLRRLAIMDVGAPAEPFTNEDGTIFCVSNGQIYNGAELRHELERKGHVFRTGVDTEVVLHLWEEHGVELVHRLDGMFAFAVWDSRRRSLMLGRDRAGEKPLFYWTDGERLLFASELRALLAHPRVTARLDPAALVRYLVHGYVPAPLSPVEGVHKLPAAHVLLAEEGRVEVSRYWDLADWFQEPGSADTRSAGELAAGLDERLSAAVRRRSRSDVPFGVLLSGGIDSATMLSYVRDAHGPGVPAFTIGHTDPSFDESGLAAETARSLGADLRRLVLDERDLEEGLRRIGEGMDEPLGDASTIPTHLLARFAREHVKVVLSGEGADELFGGYPTYFGHRLADRVERLPAWARRGLVAGIDRFAPATMGNVGLDYLLRRFAAGLGRERLERHHIWFGSVDPGRLPGLLSPALLDLLGEAGVAAPFGSARPGRELPDPLAELLYTDFTMYLQDDLLTKVDRATMLASLEARAPFLDHELVQYVAGIPSGWKLRGTTTKAILRRTVRERLPPTVLRRRKRGFNIPFSRWVLHGLGETLRERFSRERVAARGLFAYGGVRRLLDEHLSRQADHRKALFTLLALDLWCDRTFGDGAPAPWGETLSGACRSAEAGNVP
jgi:asparagine synthase (glutamine-hydrolysing)